MPKPKVAAPKMDAAGVVALYNRLKGRDSGYQSTIDRIYEAIDLDTSSPSLTYYREVTDRKRRPWEKTGAAQMPSVNINRLHQIIEDQRTYLGVQRSVRCPLPLGLYPDVNSGDMEEMVSDSELTGEIANAEGPVMTAQQYSDMMERATLYLWRCWNMGRQYSLMGWFATVPGTAVGTLHWSDEKSIPIFTVRTPKGAFFEVSPDDATEVLQAVLMSQVPGSALRQMYPECSELGDDNVEVYDYYDRTVQMRVVQGIDKPVKEVKNTINRTPVFIFPGILMPGFLGGSALMLAIPAHEELQRLYSLSIEHIQDQVRAPTVINDPIHVPEGWFWGEDATIEVGEKGMVSKANLSNVDTGMLQNLIADMKHNIDDMMDFSDVARGQAEGGGTVTGKGQNALMRKPAMRMEIRLQTMNAVMEKVMEVAFLMWQKKGKQMAIYGTQAGSYFVQPFNPKDINPDWVHVQVFVDTANFVDRQAAQVENMSKLRGDRQAMSMERFLELDPDCDDVTVEMKRIDANREKELEWQVKATKAMQEATIPTQLPSAPVGAPGGPPPESVTTPSWIAAQQAGEPAPPDMGGPPSPEGGDQGTLAAVAEHFRSIQNIHGKVFLCGLAAQGDLTPPIEVYVTDPTDKATILNSFKGDELEQIVANGDIRFLTKKPTGKKLEVTPGTDSLAPEPEEELPPPEVPGGEEGPMPGAPAPGAVPPEMAALMGGGM